MMIKKMIKKTHLKKTVHKISKLKRKQHHHMLINAHKKHNLSYRTLFYIKEYGSRSHTWHTIVHESIRILILASLISTIGGFGLHALESKILMIMPLLILLPALNDMIGDFGTVVSAKFTKLLYMNKVGRKWWKYPEMKALLRTVFVIAILSALFVGALSSFIALIRGFQVTALLFAKVILISLFATTVLVSIIFALSIASGFYVFSKKEDPNNFLIPITTSVADLGSMLLFTLLVAVLF
ncbi:MAG: magnesium transporter [Candidatus Aenigmatarchaeota archaeon]